MSINEFKNGEGIIPEGTKVIAAETYADCTDLTSIVIPDSVTEIGDFAFSGYTSLSIADFEGAVEEIGEGIFYECDRLAMILVPEGTAEHYKKRLDEEVHHLIVERTPTVVGPNTDHVLTITDTMTVGEFCHFFDYLFGGKAEVRIHNYYHGMLCESRMEDDYPMRIILKRGHVSELTLDDSMTVYEAEKLLTACVNSGYFVNIYPKKRCYRITKEMPLKDIRHLQAEPIETNNNYPEKAEDINMIYHSLDIEDVPNTRWTLYISFESKGKYYVWKRWVDRVDNKIVDAKDNISLEEFKYGKLFELCIECNVEKIFNHIENDLGFSLDAKRKERIKNIIIKGRREDWYILPERDSISDSMSTAESIVEYLTSGKTEEEWDAIYKKRQEDSEADDEDSTTPEWYNDATAEVVVNTDTEEKKTLRRSLGFRNPSRRVVRGTV